MRKAQNISKVLFFRGFDWENVSFREFQGNTSNMGIHSIPLHFKINITYKDSFFPSHNLCKYRSLASSPLHCGQSGGHSLQSLERFSQSNPENNLSLVDDYDFASNVRNRTEFLDFYTNGAMYKLPNLTAWPPQLAQCAVMTGGVCVVRCVWQYHTVGCGYQ